MFAITVCVQGPLPKGGPILYHDPGSPLRVLHVGRRNWCSLVFLSSSSSLPIRPFGPFVQCCFPIDPPANVASDV